MKRKHPLHLSLIGILAAALLLGLGGCGVEETLHARYVCKVVDGVIKTEGVRRKRCV